jgi:hypothetical protein
MEGPSFILGFSPRLRGEAAVSPAPRAASRPDSGAATPDNRGESSHQRIAQRTGTNLPVRRQSGTRSIDSYSLRGSAVYRSGQHQVGRPESSSVAGQPDRRGTARRGHSQRRRSPQPEMSRTTTRCFSRKPGRGAMPTCVYSPRWGITNLPAAILDELSRTGGTTSRRCETGAVLATQIPVDRALVNCWN